MEIFVGDVLDERVEEQRGHVLVAGIGDGFLPGKSFPPYLGRPTFPLALVGFLLDFGRKDGLPSVEAVAVGVVRHGFQNGGETGSPAVEMVAEGDGHAVLVNVPSAYRRDLLGGENRVGVCQPHIRANVPQLVDFLLPFFGFEHGFRTDA